MMRNIFYRTIFLLLFLTTNSHAEVGVHPCIDPVSTVDWDFFFDNFNIGSYGPGVEKSRDPFCTCMDADYPDFGFKMNFFEPVAFADVANVPGSWPCLEDDKFEIAKQKKRSVSEIRSASKQTGVYRTAHLITYPVFAVLNVLLDKICAGYGNIQVPFLSEVDPVWSSDFLAISINPELILYSNPIAQAACLTDCTAVSTWEVLDSMFWCEGCWISKQNGSGRPPGRLEVMEGAALTMRMLYSMAKTGSVLQTEQHNGSQALFSKLTNKSVPGEPSVAKLSCGVGEYGNPLLVKHSYAIQPAYPVSSSAVKVGRNVLDWVNFKKVPTYSDRVFTVFRRRYCCFGTIHVFVNSISGGV